MEASLSGAGSRGAEESVNLHALRDAASQSQMNGSTALHVLFIEPGERSRFERSDPGTLESFALKQLPVGREFDVLVVAALARVVVDHREIFDVRFAAAEKLLARDRVAGAVVLASLCSHPDAEAKLVGDAISESLAAPAALSTTVQRAAELIRGSLLANGTAELQEPLQTLIHFGARHPTLLAAAFAILTVEGSSNATRQEGVVFITTQFPETTKYPLRAAA